MKTQAKLVVLGLLLLPFAAAINIDNAYAEMREVVQCAGSGDANNDCFFVPSEITVNVGDTVVWLNDDSATHTITSGDVNDPDNWSAIFESGLGKPKTTFEHTFDTAGEYPYLCQLHPWMIGKVIVVEGMEDKDSMMDGIEEGKVTVTYEDNSFDVATSLSNGSVKFVDVDPDFTSLILMLETSASEDGELMITLPRALIDSKIGDADEDFIILVDGDESDYQEHSTSDTERGLTIEVPAGVEEVEIVGTVVVPEFPIAVMAVMGVIVATAIAVSRFKNPLKP
ncbi:MAG: plastocyanin/azurin family copper-binding protein [Nitrososphaerales archaeon]